MNLPFINDAADGLTIQIYVVPRSSCTQIVGEHDGRLKVRLKSPAREGQANNELVRFIAKTLQVPASSVNITQGQKGKRKTVMVRGSKPMLRELLTASLAKI